VKPSALITEGRWRLIVGLACLLGLLAVCTWQVVTANNLISCHRQAIDTLYARDQYTSQLRDLADEDSDNLQNLIAAITTPGATQESAQAAFANYQQTADDIAKEREEVRESQNDFTYPKIETCE